MKRKWPALAGLLIVIPRAYADEACKEPYAPEVAASVGASRAELLSLRNDVQSFIQASDIYQECLVQRSKSHPIEAAQIEGRLETNQHDKERVAKSLNEAIASFKNSAGAIKTSDAGR
jgi:hypothetical protein